MPFCVSPSRLLNALWQRKSHLILKYIYIYVWIKLLVLIQGYTCVIASSFYSLIFFAIGSVLRGCEIMNNSNKNVLSARMTCRDVSLDRRWGF